MNPPGELSFDIVHLIQISLTPIFLISAIGVTLSVMTGRLSRIIDRGRHLEERLRRAEVAADDAGLRATLKVLDRRARWVNLAITLITVSGLLISFVVVLLFLNAFMRAELSKIIGILFILSMLNLAAALLAFLVEVRIATGALRFGMSHATARPL